MELTLLARLQSLTFQQMRHACADDNFPELSLAIDKGFTDVFISVGDGAFLCLRNNKIYSPNEILVEPIVCTSTDASLLLIKSLDGKFRGTYIQYSNSGNNLPHNKKINNEHTIGSMGSVLL